MSDNNEIQETDDEDCIGQYPHHQGPLAPTDGAMAWMTATLEGMQHQKSPNEWHRTAGPSPADTGSTPESEAQAPSQARLRAEARQEEGDAEEGRAGGTIRYKSHGGELLFDD